jgi:putative peptidoglycan lipid II flippase
VRSSALVGVGTALSRVTGLVRTIALAYALGNTVLANSYNLANTSPNIIYDLILGGILSATLVPVFVDRYENGDRPGVNALVTMMVSARAALTIIALVAAPWIFRAYTWAAGDEAAELERAGIPLLRMFVPQILFYGLTAVAAALLNARRSFAGPAFAPVLNNVLVTGVLLWFAHVAGRSPSVGQVVDDRSLLWLLGAGTTAGIVVMTLVLWPSLRRASIGFRWRFEPRNPAVRKVASLSGWTFGYVVANQVALAIVLALATRDGDAAVYLYAFQFFQLPYGLFAVSVMTTFTPELAAAASRDDRAQFRDRLAQGLRILTLVVLPSSVGMAVLARPLIVGLLGHGSFSGEAGVVTADVLVGFAVGLLGFSVYLFAMRGFYALQDTRTPFVLNLLENGLNIVLGVALVGRYGVQGLAFAYSAAYVIAAVVALAVLRRRVGGVGGRRLGSPVARMTAAAAVMGVVVYAVSRAVGGDSGADAGVRLAAGVIVGVAVFVVALVLLRVDDVRRITGRLHR